ncbi:ATP-binding protein [Plantactinospora sp. WMMB334]|uniref:ATP-binding protein n=1 Tax=Plantactinospora sp. WMMB334 TaxID=3404119 RepID=UPI003B949121
MSVQGNLPQDIAVFVGRSDELTKGIQLLRQVRLLTLTGPGGVGKTRLALRIAAQLQMRDGAWMIDLGAMHDPQACTPDRLYAYLAMGLGIRRHKAAGLDALLDHLHDRRMLVLLDNCEHVLPAVRVGVAALLLATPHVRVLTTSRQALAIDGEHTIVVPPLSQEDAVGLFGAYARAAGAEDVALADRQAVAELCQRLDGLPLSIRLAASRVRTLSPRQLLLRFAADRFRLLSDAAGIGGDHNAERHGALERVVGWSYELCTDSEQRMWARASVFVRTFGLGAAEMVCSGSGIAAADVLDILTGLVAKSVIAVDASADPPQYFLLDTLRDYGLRKLAEAGETHRVRDRHREYHRRLLSHAASAWFGAGGLDAMESVYQDLPDVLAAIDESIRQGDPPTAREMLRNLVRSQAPFFWGFLDQCDRRLRHVLELSAAPADAADAADLSATHAALAWIATVQGHHSAAQALLTTARETERQWHLGSTGPVLFAAGANEAFGTGSSRAIPLLAAARKAYSDQDTVGDRHMATLLWAFATAVAGNPADAVVASAECLRNTYEAEADWASTWALWASATAALAGGDYSRAIEFCTRSLRLQHDMGDQWGQTWSLELHAAIIAAQLSRADKPVEEAKRAAWLLGAARTLRQRMGVTLAGLPPLAEQHARAKAAIAAMLDETAMNAAIVAGARGHTHAVRVALGKTTVRRPSASADGLTHREHEVARLVAAGLTSREIGAQLRISPRTVDAHVLNIRMKLDLPRGRAAIAAWVVGEAGHQSPVTPPGAG